MIMPQRAEMRSAATLSQAKDKPEDRDRNPDIGWQEEAYDLTDAVGELGYVVNLVANAISLCDVRGVTVDDEEIRETEGLGDQVADAVDRAIANLQDARGSRTNLLRLAGYHVTVAGESHLLGSPFDDPDELDDIGIDEDQYEMTWEFLSVAELRRESSTLGYVRRRDGSRQESIPATSFLARFWRSHPKYSDLADSPVKRVLSIAREVDRWTKVIDTAGKSRLNAGLLYIPESLQFARRNPEEEAEQTVDAFVEELFAHLSEPITDPEAATSLVPMVIKGPADAADSVKLIDLARAVDDWARELRNDAIKRLAHGLDVPPEVLEGKASLNHWSGFNIDADLVAKHIAPVADLINDFLTFGYLRPVLEALEELPARVACQVKLIIDLSVLNARSDEATSARDLHGRHLLSDEGLVRTLGFDEADMPDDEERVRRLLLEMIRSNPVKFWPLIQQLPGMEQFPVEEIKELLEAASPPATAPAPGGEGDALPDDPDAEVTDAESGSDLPDTMPETLAAMVRVRADAAVERAIERAASRVLNQATRDRSMNGRFRRIPKSQVFANLEDGELTRLGLNPNELFTDAWEELSSVTEGWVEQHLIARGVVPAIAAETARFVATELVRSVHDYAVRSAAPGRPPLVRGQDGFIVPVELVDRALELASAGVLAA